MKRYRSGLLACLTMLLGLAPPAAAQKDLPPDLAAVPADALGFVHVRLADLWKSELFRDFRDMVQKAGDDALRAFDRRFVPAPSSLDRLTVFVAAPQGKRADPEPVFILTTSKPFDREQFLKQTIPGARPQKAPGGDFYLDDKTRTAVRLVNDSTIAFGDAPAMAGWLGRAPEHSPLLQAARDAGLADKTIVIGVYGGLLPPDAARAIPDPLRPLLPQVALFSLDLTGAAKAELRLVYADAQRAADAEAAAKAGIERARQALAEFRQEALKQVLGDGKPGSISDLPVAATSLLGIGTMQYYDELLRDLPIRRTGASLHLAVTVPKGASSIVGVYASSVGLLLPAVQKVREAAARAQSANNLHQIGLAMLFHHDNKGEFPAAAIVDKKGKPLLSWRVAILPYIEQKDLYRQFKLDEPWDSEHNKKLIPLMPRTYLAPAARAQPGETCYRVFVGGGAMFDWDKPRRIADIIDGTANTIMVVEAAEGVPWTKPDELVYDPMKPLPKLGGFYSGVGFLAVLGDGSVRSVARSISEKTLRQAIMRADGEPLGADW